MKNISDKESNKTAFKIEAENEMPIQPEKNDPFKENENDNDPTRISPDKNSPERIVPGKPGTSPEISPGTHQKTVENKIIRKIKSTAKYSAILFSLSFLTLSHDISARDSEKIDASKKSELSTGGIQSISEMSKEELVSRLFEIRSMKINELTKSQKHELRTEVKAIKSELKEKTDGVFLYLSGTAILIIILLLILL